jgi:hypothetical protein
MVADYGMGSTELQSRKLPADDYSMSEAMRRSIDEEQQHISDRAHRRALALVVEHRDLLDKLAERLLQNEVLERGDIDEIMGRVPSAPPGEDGEAASAEEARQGSEAASAETAGEGSVTGSAERPRIAASRRLGPLGRDPADHGD